MIGVSKWTVRALLSLMVLVLSGIGALYLQLGSISRQLAVTTEIARRNSELIGELRAEIRKHDSTTEVKTM